MYEMAEEVVNTARAAIEEAEKQLAEARDLLTRLRKAGEDVTQAETEYRATKLRLDRYKRAFK